LRFIRRAFQRLLVLPFLALAVVPGPTAASATTAPPGALIVSRSVYEGTASTVTAGQTLPGGGTAVAYGTFPGVWANATPDPSFGVTSPIFLDRYAVSGTTLTPVSTLNVPSTGHFQLVTSFSSKSELALNLSPNGKWVTFMGYNSTPNALDVSNSNTPNHVDPTNPVAEQAQRAVGQIDATGASSRVHVTYVNTYSGNNGRAAIMDNDDDQYILVGNAGNGSSPEPVNIVSDTGVQVVPPGGGPESTVIGVQQGTPGAKNGFDYGFDVTQIGDPADKSGKDDNFRSLAILNHTLFVAKGSGGNGINTVYQVGNAGTLPTASTGPTTTINIVPGFPTLLANSASGVQNPFGLWFANPTTLYVADEGDGKSADAGTGPFAGLEKWVLENDGTWHNVYTLQNGLNLGVPYAVPGLDPSLEPSTDGLRSLTGRVNGDGTVTLFSVTSTVSNIGDQGADSNELVTITDTVANLDPTVASTETFTVLQTAAFAQVLRGVVFVPPSGS
jgi:hypothetical protein